MYATKTICLTRPRCFLRLIMNPKGIGLPTIATDCFHRGAKGILPASLLHIGSLGLGESLNLR